MMAVSPAIGLRLPQAILDRLDELAPLLAAAPELALSHKVSRSQAIQLAILRGLEVLEREYKTQDNSG